MTGIGKNRKLSVDHFVDGREAWDEGYGLFLRHRNAIGSVAFGFSTAGIPWWIPTESSSNFPSNYAIAISLLLASLGLLVCGLIYWFRKRLFRSLRIKRAMHDFAHTLRDQVNSIYSASGIPDIKLISNNICPCIRDFFKESINPSDQLGKVCTTSAPLARCETVTA